MWEHGKENRLYPARATAWFYWWPLPITPADGNMMGDHLFDHRVYWWDCCAGYEMAWGARQRSVLTILELAQGASPAPYWMGEVKQTTAPKRWILGSDPLIIALGTEVGPIEPYKGTYALVREADLDKTATELLVLDHWPPKWKFTGSEWQKEFEAKLAKVTRRIKLEHPMTLREIAAKRLWEQ